MILKPNGTNGVFVPLGVFVDISGDIYYLVCLVIVVFTLVNLSQKFSTKDQMKTDIEIGIAQKKLSLSNSR